MSLNEEIEYLEEESQLATKDDFIETESLLIAKKPDENGAYMAHVKVSAIASRGEGKSEREALAYRAHKELKKAREKIGAKKLRPRL